MKKISFLLLFLSILFVPAALFAAASVSGSVSASTTAVTATSMDQTAMIAMVRPMLENYSVHHPDSEVRVWSMVILVHLKDIDQEELLSVPILVQLMGNKDENIRLIAMNTIRKAMSLDDEEWQGIMAPLLRTYAKTAKYPEIRKLAIRALAAIADMDMKTTTNLPLLFELAQDTDPEIRKIADDSIEEILAKKGGGTGSGGGGGAAAAPAGLP